MKEPTFQPAPIDLVIFDCDGVLVDSEVLGNQVLVDYLATMGMSMPLGDAVRQFRGCKMADLVVEVERRFECKLPETFATDFRARMAEAFKTELRAIEGIAAAIEAIRLPMCVASSGPRAKIELSLTLTGLMPHFEGRIFSAYEINKWKPDPGIFLHAAKTIGVTPANCLIVEDSILGVQAAVAAGMRVVGYAPDLEQAEILKKAGAIVLPVMLELPELISSLNIHI